ncbi:MAG: FG-GAP-like repeat-containing protein [Planctomycetota bacterium]|nr:FG-GAP-like repeat-containing protein [Planctomycetota bacterium]
MCRSVPGAMFLILLMTAGVYAQAWPTFVDETAARMPTGPGLNDPAFTTGDTQDKNYAWADVDKDGDIDLVCVRKVAYLIGRLRNVLYMNEGIAEGHAIDGVLVDRTAQYASEATDGGLGMLDLTDDRDVAFVDVDGDTWLDIVTTTTYGQGLPKTISHPRVYINKGESEGVWQGFRYEEARTPTMSMAPNFCGIGHGDVTGDGFPDLYHIDYNHELEDRLWINDGFGFFTDDSEARMTFEMRESEFGVHAEIADMNGDGAMDVIKDRANGAPYRISISYNDPNNEGFFDVFETVYTGSPYYVEIADLNNDGLLDIVLQDDGIDRYLLNQGNGPDGRADFVTFAFPPSSNGFEGTIELADLNNDGFIDVLVTDETVNAIGTPCVRRMHIWRNMGDIPDVTFQEDTGGIPVGELAGTSDVAPIDINGDGWPDLVIGRCGGTSVWISQPPIGMDFEIPGGVPTLLAPDGSAEVEVGIVAVGEPLDPTSPAVHISVNGGPFASTPMTPLGGDLYRASFGAFVCLDQVSFYFSAALSGGGVFTDPADGASSPYVATAANGSLISFRDELEGDVSGWTVMNDPGLVSGGWAAAAPNGTLFGGAPAAPFADATVGSGNEIAFVTENGAAGGNAADSDVDGGPTFLLSPVFDLGGTDARITYARWFFSSDAGTPDGDLLLTEVSSDGGSNWTAVHSTGGTSGVWETASFRVGDFVTPTAAVRVRFSTSDASSSVTEAGVDDFQVSEFVCDDCIVAGDCVDALFCNGEESCAGGDCQPGTSPCIGRLCDEANDICVDCLSDGDCDDGVFCNGAEQCVGGVCQPGKPPCAGQLCDESNNVCQGCLTAANCADGLFCNGVERCIDGACFAAIGVANNGFDGSTAWVDNVPVNPGEESAISYAGNDLNVTGPENDTNVGGFAWASQGSVELNGSGLEFDLLSYASADTVDWDRPVLYVDGSFYGLNDDGTLGPVIPAPAQGAFGTIDNGNPVAVPIHFVIDVEGLFGPGGHEIGFGVMSVDGDLGAGIAVFDSVLPGPGPLDPCAGACNELNDACGIAVQPAMGDPLPDLAADEFARFVAGKASFEEVLTPPNGLGPVFNRDACVSCHSVPGVGGSGSVLVTRFGFVDKSGFDPLTQFGGSLLQAQSLAGCQEVIPPEANIVANRLTPHTFGLGLVEAIADADLLANETSPPPNVSGVAHMVQPLEDPGGPARVGRFGWKAQVATGLSFSGDAALNEMGLTNRLVPAENDPNGIRAPDLEACDTVADPEDGPEGGNPGNPHFIDRVTDFQRFLAPPPQTPKSGMSGEAIFNNIGCAECHVQSFTTGPAAEGALSGKVIQPYSDFLLHDMGTLGDGIEQGGASESEMRTAPLWGLRVRAQLLHDGRATGGGFGQRIRAAIAEHGAAGSEAAFSEANFEASTPAEQDALIAFLDSLGRREFDHDGDNDVDPADLAEFANCFTGPVGFHTPDDPCSISDIDSDGDVDSGDFQHFLTVYDGSQADCNGNGANDARDIVTGTSGDCNSNGIPDSCDSESSDVALFVAQLLLDDQDSILVCMLDQDGNLVLNGGDVQSFVATLVGR